MRSRMLVPLVAVSGAAALSGCTLTEWSVGGGGSTTDGSIALTGDVLGFPVGQGAFRASIAPAEPPAAGCTPATATVSLEDPEGATITKAETGELCATRVADRYRFTGTYVITGGTGRFAGAAGSGWTSVTLNLSQRPPAPFTAVELGTWALPGGRERRMELRSVGRD